VQQASLFGAACIALAIAALAHEAILAPPPPAAPAELGDAERAQIYAVVVDRLTTQDDTFGGSLHPTRVVIDRTLRPDCPYRDPAEPVNRWHVPRPQSPRFCPGQPTGRLAASVEAALAASPPSHAALSFVDDARQLHADPQTGKIDGGGVLLTLHAIVSPEPGVVATDGEIHIANEAAGGQRYLFRRRDGHWTLVRTVPGWIS